MASKKKIPKIPKHSRRRIKALSAKVEGLMNHQIELEEKRYEMLQEIYDNVLSKSNNSKSGDQ